jgi:predicted anti-sigma-YlaC factor YlaD
MNCKICQASLPDLLLDRAAPANAVAFEHLAACAACNDQFRALKATFDLLDYWQAPEPSPYFDQKLAVRIREEQAAPPAGWFERMRARLLFNTGRQFRPALTGALALVVLLAGGTAADLSLVHSGTGVQASATVNDLQILDKNAQALQTMDQLLQDESSSDESPAPPST